MEALITPLYKALEHLTLLRGHIASGDIRSPNLCDKYLPTNLRLKKLHFDHDVLPNLLRLRLISDELL